MRIHGYLSLFACSCVFVAGVVVAQPTPAPEPPDTAPPAAPSTPAAPAAPPPPAAPAADGGTDAQPPESEAPANPQPEQQPEEQPDAGPPRGDVPISVEAVVNPNAPHEPEPPREEPQPPAQQPEQAPPPTAATPEQPAQPEQPPVTPEQPAKPEQPPAKPEKPSKPEQPPAKPEKPSKREKPSKPEKPAEAKAPPPPTAAALVTWVTAGWSAALGSARCANRGIQGTESAIKLASTLNHSASVAGFGIGAAGTLGDHPLIAFAAHEAPERLADLIAGAGFSALAVGIADLNGPLLREPRLSEALAQRGVKIIASNFVCGNRDFCSTWATAEKPITLLERDGRRYAYFALLPDDVLGRVEPSGGRRVEVRPMADAITERTREARAAGAELVIASVDHGPDATASINLANFVSTLPPDTRPDLLFSPSSGESMLFMRPLDVAPAIVGTRRGVLTGVRVTKLPDTRDADVFARSVRQSDWNDALAQQVVELGAAYCAKRGDPLHGGDLEATLDHDDFLTLAGAAVRELADSDLALIDPLDYAPDFSQRGAGRLQRGQVERAVMLDSPLVTALVSLDWLTNLNKGLDGLRPLKLIGSSNENGTALIAGRAPVTGAMYRIVTTAVLARSGRLPGGPDWSPIDDPHATLRGALLAHLEVDEPGDPRTRLRDPTLGTQWILRTDGQIQGNLTATHNPEKYDEPALQVNNTRQLGVRLLVNLDADSPGFLFENAGQLAFDRNWATHTSAEDLAFLQSVYTYRGLWPRPLLYPHPFVEGYAETTFTKGSAAYHHFLVRPKLGLRSMITRMLSFKAFGAVQYEVFQPDHEVTPGLGAELLLKPWTIAASNGNWQLEGNVIYFWNNPGASEQHTLRGQVIAGFTMIGPLQFTLTALGAIRKDAGQRWGKGIGLTAGIRLRFVNRSMND